MFCGKGGVGKTTCAAATALHFAKNHLKTLLLSTDPTPSLSDILEMEIGREVRKVEGFSHLHAVELDYEVIIEEWKARFGREVYEVASSFLPVGEEIIEYVANAPGISEEFSLSYILDLYEGGGYDVIVWDTAPAGGTLSLLKLQEKFYRHLREAAWLYVKIRRTLEVLAGGKLKRNPLTVIKEWENLSWKILQMLRDKETQAILVTIAEALAVRQTARLVRELEAHGIRIGGVVVNQLVGDECSCSFHRKRSAMQKDYLNQLKAYVHYRLTPLPQLPQEVKGIETLQTIEKLLFPKP
ncbi:MAG: ATPase [Candidatus Hecatellales archaeon]|nr:MAG: ATPase [Candidatus Hecatellales archaeon]